MRPPEDRPLITFGLVAYNQERFVAEAVQGAFGQTYSPLEIIISDDCSTDRTFEIIQEQAAGYAGPHNVIVRRNERNVGLAEHLNRLMTVARGELIVGAAGDDVSLSERVQTLFDAYVDSARRALSLFSNAYMIDEDGKQTGLLHSSPPTTEDLGIRRFSLQQRSVSGSTHAWHRRVFDEFGPIHSEVISEDAVIPFRALLLGELKYVDEPLILRRHHDRNIWLHPRSSSYRSFVEWNTRQMDRGIQNNLAILATRARDLTTFTTLYPESKEEIDWLVQTTASRIEGCYLERELLKAGLWGKMGTVHVARKRGVPLRRLARWCAEYFSPQFYFTVRWLQLRWMQGAKGLR